MKAVRRTMNWPIGCMFVVLAGALVYQSHADRQGNAPPEPSVVATVNLESIFKQLNQRAEADGELLELAEELDAEGLRRREALDGLREELEFFEPGNPKYEETSQEIAKLTFQLQAFMEFATRKLDVYKARALRRLYMSIRDDVRIYAEKYGYDVVFVDDSVVPVPSEGTEAEMMRQISARRTIYSSPMIDITEEVIQMMNARFADGG